MDTASLSHLATCRLPTARLPSHAGAPEARGPGSRQPRAGPAQKTRAGQGAGPTAPAGGQHVLWPWLPHSSWGPRDWEGSEVPVTDTEGSPQRSLRIPPRKSVAASPRGHLLLSIYFRGGRHIHALALFSTAHVGRTLPEPEPWTQRSWAWKPRNTLSCRFPLSPDLSPSGRVSVPSVTSCSSLTQSLMYLSWPVKGRRKIFPGNQEETGVTAHGLLPPYRRCLGVVSATPGQPAFAPRTGQAPLLPPSPSPGMLHPGPSGQNWR